MKLFVRDKDTSTEHIFAEADGYTPAGNEQEVTDIVEIEDFGLRIVNIENKGWFDRKAVRDRLKVSVYTKMGVALPADVEDQTKWDLLTAAEKSIAAHWFLVGKHSFQDEVVDDTANNRRYWKCEALKYRDWTTQARERRLQLMEAVVFCGILDVNDAKDIMKQLDQISKDEEFEFDASLATPNTKAKLVSPVRFKKMRSMYQDGIQSKAEDGIDALRDYIDSTAGTLYENNGFRSYTYATRGSYTIDTLADELLSVIDGTW